jgi:NADH-quinone oxidoreductase subunit F
VPTLDEIKATALPAWQAVLSPKRTLIKVGIATCSRSVGADATLAAIRREVAAGGLEADVMQTGCLGICYAEPLVEVVRPGGPTVLYQGVTEDRVAALLEGALNGVVFDQALAVRGTEAVGRVPALQSLPFWHGQVRRLRASSTTWRIMAMRD